MTANVLKSWNVTWALKDTEPAGACVLKAAARIAILWRIQMIRSIVLSLAAAAAFARATSASQIDPTDSRTSLAARLLVPAKDLRINGAALLPRSRRIVYTSEGETEYDGGVAVVGMEAGAEPMLLPLPTTLDLERFFVSPDGRRLAINLIESDAKQYWVQHHDVLLVTFDPFKQQRLTPSAYAHGWLSNKEILVTDGIWGKNTFALPLDGSPLRPVAATISHTPYKWRTAGALGNKKVSAINGVNTAVATATSGRGAVSVTVALLGRQGAAGKQVTLPSSAHGLILQLLWGPGDEYLVAVLPYNGIYVISAVPAKK